MFDWINIIIEGIGSDITYIQSFWIGTFLGVSALIVSALVALLFRFGNLDRHSKTEELSFIGATFVFVSGLGSAFSLIISAISFLIAAIPVGGISAGEVIPIAFLTVVIGGLLVGFAAAVAEIK